MLPKESWHDAAGTIHPFHAYELDDLPPSWPFPQGIFIYVKRTAGTVRPLYIGQGVYSECLPPDKYACIIDKGANQIHLWQCRDTNDRVKMQKRLRDHHTECYFPNGCNESETGSDASN
jgi:hypothetical protein